MDDVVVVGGGIAGCLSALAAKRARPDASVGLVSAEETTLRAASGLVDLLGYVEDELVSDPFGAIPDLPAGHPYRRVDLDRLREGLALFDDVVGDAYGGRETDQNALVPTYGGRVKPTARYPRAVEAGLASERRRTTVVGFAELTAVDAELTADRLSARLPYDFNGLTCDFPGDIETTAGNVDTTPLQCARTLDQGEDRWLDLADSVFEGLDNRLTLNDRVGFPAVLGLQTASAVRESLEDRLGRRVFEIPMGPPSVPGLRLQSLLGEGLTEAGVSVETGTRVTSVNAADGVVESIELEGAGQTLRGSQFVLATGGLVGGGITSDRRTVREPIFDCHVEAPPDRDDWSRDSQFGDHPFARFGLAVDDRLRPLDSTGTPEFENLRAAGSVLGGYDLAAELSGSGVSIATGYAAGVAAVETL